MIPSAFVFALAFNLIFTNTSTVVATPIEAPLDPEEPFSSSSSSTEYMSIAPQWMQRLVNQRYAECLLDWFRNREDHVGDFWFLHEMNCHEGDRTTFWHNTPVFPDGPRFGLEVEPASEEELIARLGHRYVRPQQQQEQSSASPDNRETQHERGESSSGPFLPFALDNAAKRLKDNLGRLGTGLGTALRGVSVPKPLMGGPVVRPITEFMPFR
ncbi:MAG: hypothetical protein M1816_007137 [Peltula sp. TS41687]|nr:MAG: hypothetical protein M1816_007137 [Peltula sp. TS41687]